MSPNETAGWVTPKSIVRSWRCSKAAEGKPINELYFDGDRNPDRGRRYKPQLHGANEIYSQMGLGKRLVSLDGFRAHNSAPCGHFRDHSKSISGLPFSPAGHNSRSLWIWCGVGSSTSLFRTCGGHGWDYARILYRFGNLCGCGQPGPNGFSASRTPPQCSRVCSPRRKCLGPIGCDALCCRWQNTRGTEYAVDFIAKKNIARTTAFYFVRPFGVLHEFRSRLRNTIG